MRWCFFVFVQKEGSSSSTTSLSLSVVTKFLAKTRLTYSTLECTFWHIDRVWPLYLTNERNYFPPAWKIREEDKLNQRIPKFPSCSCSSQHAVKEKERKVNNHRCKENSIAGFNSPYLCNDVSQVDVLDADHVHFFQPTHVDLRSLGSENDNRQQPKPAKVAETTTQDETSDR